MIFRTWKSRSLHKLPPPSLHKADQNPQVISKQKSRSCDKLPLLMVLQQKIVTKEKKASRFPLINKEKTSKPLLKIDRKQSSFKTKQNLNFSFTRSMDFQKNLKDQVPEQGYIYLDIKQLHNGISERRQMRVIVQRGKVLVECEDQSFYVELYSIQRFNRILQISLRMKKLEYFKSYYITKFFFTWSNYLKSKRFTQLQKSIMSRVTRLSIIRWSQIWVELVKRKRESFLLHKEKKHLYLEKFKQYIDELCEQYSERSCSYCCKIQALCIVLFEKDSAQILAQTIIDGTMQGQLKLSIEHGLNAKESLRRQIHLSGVIQIYQVVFRKLILRQSELCLEEYSFFLDEIKQDLKKSYQSYMGIKKLLTEQFDKYSKFTKAGHLNQPTLFKSIKQAEKNNKSVLIRVDYGVQKAEDLCYFQQLRSKFQDILKEMVRKVEDILNDQNFFNYSIQNDEIKIQIFGNAKQKMNTYSFKKLKEERENLNNGKWIQQLVCSQIKQLRQLFSIISFSLSDVIQYLKLCNHIRLGADGQSDKQIVSNKVQTKIGCLNLDVFYILQHYQFYLNKIKALPQFINVGSFSISFKDFQNNFEQQAQKTFDGIKEQLPSFFDEISSSAFWDLNQIDEALTVYNWNLVQYSKSFRAQLKYNEMLQGGSLLHHQETLEKLLKIFSRVSEYLYKEKYRSYFQLKYVQTKISQKIRIIDSQKFDSIKNLKIKLKQADSLIELKLKNIQKALHESINEGRSLEPGFFLHKVGLFQNQLEEVKLQIEDVSLIIYFMYEKWRHYTEDQSDHSLYNKLSKDLHMIKELLQNLSEIEQQAEEVYEQELGSKSKKFEKLYQLVSEKLVEINIAKQQLTIYKSLLVQMEKRYEEHFKILKIAEQIYGFEEEDLHQLKQKKCNDQKSIFYGIIKIKDLRKIRINLCQTQLQQLKTKQNYKRQIKSLDSSYKQFIQKTFVQLQVQIISLDLNSEKYQKEVQKKQHNSEQQINSQKDRNNQRKSQNWINLNQKKVEARRNKIQASVSQSVGVFEIKEDVFTKLNDFDFQANRKLDYFPSLLDQKRRQIKKEVGVILKTLGSLKNNQQQYLKLLKNGFIKGISIFLELENMLEDAKNMWLQITEMYKFKSLSYFCKKYRNLQKQLVVFSNLLRSIKKTISIKIQDKRKQISLLNLCSNQKILKIIKNPLSFIHQFYSSVEFISLNPEEKTLLLETSYQQQLSVIFKHRSCIQLSRLRQHIARFIKYKCFNLIQERDQSFGDQGIYKPLITQNKNQLIQIAYLTYWKRMKAHIKSDSINQPKIKLINQIKKIASYYSKLQLEDKIILLKLDMMILMCIQWKNRVYQSSSLKQYYYDYIFISSNEKNNSESENSLSSGSNSSNDELLQNAFKNVITFVINKQRRVSRKSSIMNEFLFEKTKRVLEIEKSRPEEIIKNIESRQFQNFKIILTCGNESLQLGYDLLNAKYLTHFSLSEKNLLWLFNSFRLKGCRPVLQTQVYLQQISSRLFQLYRSVDHHFISEHSPSLIEDIINLKNITIGFRCKNLKLAVQMFESIQKKIDENPLEFGDGIIQSKRMKVNGGLFFIKEQKQTNKEHLNNKYRIIEIELPKQDQLLQLYGQCLKQKYSKSIVENGIRYVKDYRFLMAQIKQEFFSFHQTKLFFRKILEQISSILSLPKDKSKKIEPAFVYQQLFNLLSSPLHVIGLQEYHIRKYADEAIANIMGSEFIQEAKKTKQDSGTQKILQSRFTQALKPFCFEQHVGEWRKVYAFLGQPFSGKSYMTKKFVGNIQKQKYFINYVNVSLFLQFTSYVSSAENFQQLKQKLLLKQFGKLDGVRKLLVVFDGFERVPTSKIQDIIEWLTFLEFDIVQRSFRRILELTSLKNISPSSFLKLQILNIRQGGNNFLEQFFSVLQVELKNEILKFEFSECEDANQSIAMAKKTKGQLIIDQVKKISNGIKAICEKLPNLQLIIGEKQYYHCLRLYFCSYIKSFHDQLYTLYQKSYSIFIEGIQKIGAHCVYWTLFYNLTDHKKRQQLFGHLFLIQQFKFLYSGTILTKSSQIKVIPSNLSVIRNLDLQDKDLSINDSGVNYLTQKRPLYLQKNSFGTDSYINVEFPYIQKMRTYSQVLLQNNLQVKGLCIFGQRSTGKSKFINCLMDNPLKSTNSKNLHACFTKIKLQFSMEDNLYTQQPRDEKNILFKNSNKKAIFNFYQSMYQRAKKDDPSPIMLKYNKLTFVYIDDHSLPWQIGVQHHALKTLVQHSLVLFNDSFIQIQEPKIFNQISRACIDKEKIKKQLERKWFLFPLFYCVGENDISFVFSTLVDYCLRPKQSSFDEILEDNQKKMVQVNYQKVVKIASSSQNIKLDMIEKIVRKFTLKGIINYQVLKRGYQSMDQAYGQFLGSLNVKGIYKSVIDYLNIQSGNQPDFIPSISSSISLSCKNIKICPKIKLEDIILFNLLAKFPREERSKYLARILSENICFQGEKKKQTKLFQKAFQQIYLGEGTSQLIQLRRILIQMGSLRKPIIVKQMHENIFKLKFALQISRLVFVNRVKTLQKDNFIQLACKILGFKLYKIQEDQCFNYKRLIQKLQVQNRQRQLYVYIPLPVLIRTPSILQSIITQLNIFYETNLSELGQWEDIKNWSQKKLMSLKDHLTQYSSSVAQNSFETSYKSFSDYKNIKFIIEYSTYPAYSNIFFEANSGMISYASFVYLQPFTFDSDFEHLKFHQKADIKKERTYADSKQQNIFQNEKISTYLLKLKYSQKLSHEQIMRFSRFSERAFESISKQLKQVLPGNIYKLIFTNWNLYSFSQTFTELYTKRKCHIENCLVSLESTKNYLESLFASFQKLRSSYSGFVEAGMQLEGKISELNKKRIKLQSEIEQYIKSGCRERKEFLDKRRRINEKKINEFKTQKDQHRKQLFQAHERIGRTQIAQLKFFFNTSFDLHIPLFQVIGVLLKQDIKLIQPNDDFNKTSIDKQLLQKYFGDINLMSKLKQIKHEGLSKMQTSFLLSMKKEMVEGKKIESLKKICQWIVLLIKYIEITDRESAQINSLYRQIMVDLQQIKQITLRYDFQQYLQQLSELKYKISSIQEQMTKNRQISTQTYRKIACLGKIVQPFNKFNSLCKDKIEQFFSDREDLIFSSLIGAIQSTIVSSIPHDLKKQCRLKCIKQGQRILMSYFSYKMQKGSLIRDSIKQQLKIMTAFPENSHFCITHPQIYLFTEQKKKTLNIILRKLIYNNLSCLTLTIIDPQNIFLRDLRMFCRKITFKLVTEKQFDRPDIIQELPEVDILIFKIPAQQWCIQILKEGEIKKFNHCSVKWRNKKIKLKQNQRCILLKSLLTDISELTIENHQILFYNQEKFEDKVQIVGNILKKFHYDERINELNQANTEILSFKQAEKETQKAFIMILNKIIECIGSNFNENSLQDIEYLKRVQADIQKLFIVKCELENIQKTISQIEKLQFFYHHPQVYEQSFQISSLSQFRQYEPKLRVFCQLILFGWETVQQIYRRQMRLFPKKTVNLQSNCLQSSIIQQSQLDIKILKSGIEGALKHAKKSNDVKERETSLTFQFLKFLFNFLCLLIDDEFDFYFGMQLKIAQIGKDNDLSYIPIEMLKVLSFNQVWENKQQKRALFLQKKKVKRIRANTSEILRQQSNKGLDSNEIVEVQGQIGQKKRLSMLQSSMEHGIRKKQKQNFVRLQCQVYRNKIKYQNSLGLNTHLEKVSENLNRELRRQKNIYSRLLEGKRFNSVSQSKLSLKESENILYSIHKPAFMVKKVEESKKSMSIFSFQSRQNIMRESINLMLSSEQKYVIRCSVSSQQLSILRKVMRESNKLIEQAIMQTSSQYQQLQQAYPYFILMDSYPMEKYEKPAVLNKQVELRKNKIIVVIWDSTIFDADQSAQIERNQKQLVEILASKKRAIILNLNASRSNIYRNIQNLQQKDGVIEKLQELSCYHLNFYQMLRVIDYSEQLQRIRNQILGNPYCKNTERLNLIKKYRQLLRHGVQYRQKIQRISTQIAFNECIALFSDTSLLKTFVQNQFLPHLRFKSKIYRKMLQMVSQQQAESICLLLTPVLPYFSQNGTNCEKRMYLSEINQLFNYIKKNHHVILKLEQILKNKINIRLKDDQMEMGGDPERAEILEKKRISRQQKSRKSSELYQITEERSQLVQKIRVHQKYFDTIKNSEVYYHCKEAIFYISSLLKILQQFKWESLSVNTTQESYHTFYEQFIKIVFHLESILVWQQNDNKIYYNNLVHSTSKMMLNRSIHYKAIEDCLFSKVPTEPQATPTKTKEPKLCLPLKKYLHQTLLQSLQQNSHEIVIETQEKRRSGLRANLKCKNNERLSFEQIYFKSSKI